MNQNIATIQEEFVNGNPWNALYELTETSKNFYFAARGIVRRAEIAEEVIQESIVKAIENKNQFNPQFNLFSWFYQIVRNHALNVLKKDQRAILSSTLQSNSEEADFDPFLAILTDSHAGPSEIVSGNEEFQQVLDSIQYFETFTKPNGRTPYARNMQMLKMHILNNKPYKKISEELNIPMGTVMSGINAARKLIKEDVQEVKPKVKPIGKPLFANR
jgi:RNA polymerase sigma-70 factor (ECF subfamily)